MGARQTRSQMQEQSAFRPGSHVQPVVINDFQQHINPNDPNPRYAVRVDGRPEITQAMKVALSNRGLLSKMQKNHDQIFFIKEKGCYYQGQWNNGLPNGLGNALNREGYFYEGRFVNGVASAEDGLIVYPNGSIYEGRVDNATLNGYGKLIYPNDLMTYQGNFKNGRPDGQGQQIFRDARYKGSFRNGVKHGLGTYIWDEGAMNYQGEFKEGEMTGKGVLTNSRDGGRFEGQFVQGKKNGYGVFANSFGQYKGTFRDQRLNGPGIFRWKDGKIYDGQFKDSKMHGRGKIIYPNRQVVQGVWQNDHNLSLDAVHNNEVRLEDHRGQQAPVHYQNQQINYSNRSNQQLSHSSLSNKQINSGLEPQFIHDPQYPVNPKINTHVSPHVNPIAYSNQKIHGHENVNYA